VSSGEPCCDHASSSQTLSVQSGEMRDFSNFMTICVVSKICGNLLVDSTPDADAVNFPGSKNYMTISPCPSGQNFCHRIDDYPKNVHIDDRLLSNKLIKQKIFDDKIIQTRFSINTRRGEEKRACATRKDVVYPKKARNTKGRFLFIVNDNQYRQAVEIEKCVDEGQKCLTDDDAPVSRRTLCKQLYATYKLYAIDTNREQVYDSFSLPSACICHYKAPTSFRSSIQSRARNNLPFCKAGTRLNFPNSNSLKQENSVSTPILEQQPSRPSISGRQPSQNIRFSQASRQPSGNRETNQSRRRRRRRNRRNHQNRNPTSYIQSYDRGTIWQRDTRRSRLYTESDCSTRSSTYCMSPRNYPTNRILNEIGANAVISGDIYKQVFDSQCTNIIATRGFSIDEDPLCSGIRRVIFPRRARNMENQWKFVVNIDNFTQSIEIEECDDRFVFSQESSDEFGDCLYSGSQGNNPEFTACKQIYTEHKLLALTEGGKLEVDRFMLPSACACFVQPFFGLELL